MTNDKSPKKSEIRSPKEVRNPLIVVSRGHIWFSRRFHLVLHSFGFLLSFDIRHSLVIVSSKFKIVRLTMAQAATLCRFTSSGIFSRSGTATLTAEEE